jgi:hypothetical protein
MTIGIAAFHTSTPENGQTFGGQQTNALIELIRWIYTFSKLPRDRQVSMLPAVVST